jgi:dipeptidyl-peptidase-4
MIRGRPDALTVSVIIGTLMLATFTAEGVAGAENVGRSLEDLFGGGTVEPDVAWRPDHDTVVWVDHVDPGMPTLVELDPATGDQKVLLNPAVIAELWADRAGEPPTLGDPLWRPDGSSVVLRNPAGLVLVELDDGDVTVITDRGGDERHITFAPDGRRMAWVRDNDLYVSDLKTNRELRLTDDGSDTVFNGIFDWVYAEELASRDGRAYAWADDGSALVWLRLDDGAVPVHHLLDAMTLHTTVIEQRVPQPGDPSPVPSLHVVRFDRNGETVLPFSLGFDAPTPYVPRFGFAPDGDLWYQRMDRAQHCLELVRVDLETAEATIAVDESDPDWVEPADGVRFLDDGSLLWPSRREGSLHLVRVLSDGTSLDLTPGPGDVTELIGLNTDQRALWYQAARPRARDRGIFRTSLDEEGPSERVVGGTGGTHEGLLSPSGRMLLIRSSSVDSPPRWWVANGLGDRLTAIPLESTAPAPPQVEHRWLDLKADDGLELEALLMLPSDFDPACRYPVVIYTYGGPHAQVTRDVWPRTSGLFNRYLASRGFIVFALDNRGSAARGHDFEVAAAMRLGASQLPDQLAGVRWLVDQPWVDSDRIAIWGWSYGGYMTCYALTHAPGVFAAGAAVAPVTDWRLYDSIYTERYMGMPDDNPDGYAAASVLDAVGALSDPLLVIHGTSDDNVHVQHTLQLADRAWRSNVRFGLMLMPGLGHGLRAEGAHETVFAAIAEYFETHLARTRVTAD